MQKARSSKHWLKIEFTIEPDSSDHCIKSGVGFYYVKCGLEMSHMPKQSTLATVGILLQSISWNGAEGVLDLQRGSVNPGLTMRGQW